MDKTYLGRSIEDFSPGIESKPITKVELLDENGDIVGVAGNDSGKTLTAQNPDGTNEMAQAILAKVSGYTHIGYEGQNAMIDPAAEIGDAVTVSGHYVPIVSTDSTFDSLLAVNISAPDADELDDEYPYKSKTQRQIERNMAVTRSLITKSAEEINLEIQGVDGRVSALQLTVQGIESQVSDAQGNISTLQQTAQSLQSQVNGKIDGDDAQTLIDQTLEGISLSVSGTDGSTTFELKQGSVTLDSTTFDLHVSSVNIEGTLTADEIKGSTFELLDNSDYVAATFYLTGASSIDDTKMVINTGALELDSNGGDIYIAANTYRGSLVSALQIKGSLSQVSCEGDFVPNSSQLYDLGESGLYWNNIYCYSSAIDLSDKKEKIDISYLTNSIKMDAFFDGLRPASYKMLHGTSGRTHYGMIAQDVEELMQVLGMDSKDFAGFVKSEKDEETHYGLRYGEFIALCIDQIQRLKKRVKALEGIA